MVNIRMNSSNTDDDNGQLVVKNDDNGDNQW